MYKRLNNCVVPNSGGVLVVGDVGFYVTATTKTASLAWRGSYSITY